MDLPNMHDNGRVLDDLDNWRKIFWDETLVEDRTPIRLAAYGDREQDQAVFHFREFRI